MAVPFTTYASAKQPSLPTASDADDDIIRYNKRLKDRRDRLLDELKKLEAENTTHCETLRELLKPLQLFKQDSDDDDDDDENANDNDDQKNTTTTAASTACAADGDYDEFIIPEMKQEMTEESRAHFLSLLIRYLSSINQCQRNEIKSLYLKQSTLYFQAQGLSLNEQCEFQQALRRSNTALLSMDSTQHARQLLLKCPDAIALADAYEQFVTRTKNIHVNAEDNGAWLRSSAQQQQHQPSSSLMDDDHGHSVNTSISPTLSFVSPPTSPIAMTPMTPGNSGKKQIFTFGKKKSSAATAPPTMMMAGGTVSRESRHGSTESNTSTMSVASLPVQKSEPVMHRHPHHFNKSNAPRVGNTTRKSGISGARLVRFDADYKQIMCRRQRCDIASIVAALQNTHAVHAKLKQRTPNMGTAGEDPLSAVQNYGFDLKYVNGRSYTFDGILEDQETLRRHKEEAQRNNVPMTPAMHAITPSASATLGPTAPSHAYTHSTPRLTGMDPYALLSPALSGHGGGGTEAGSSRTMHSIINSSHNIGSSGVFAGLLFGEDVDDAKDPAIHSDQSTVISSAHTTQSTLSTPLFNGRSRNSSRSRSVRHAADPSQAFSQLSRPVMTVHRGGRDKPTKEKHGWVTLKMFVFLATNFDSHGQTDAQALVLTHRTFCKSASLLKCIQRRFWMPIPPNLSPTELSAFKTTFVKQIRGKVVAVVRYWLLNHWSDDFRDDPSLQDAMKRFIDDINDNQETQSMAVFLAHAFKKQQKEMQDARFSVIIQTNRKQKVVKFFYDHKTIDILDFKPEETAACIIESDSAALLCIDQRECFLYIKDKERAPHVSNMIAIYNSTVNWAQREILSPKRDFKQRVQCMRYFIQMLEILVNYGNFCGAYALYAALSSTNIDRLKSYWAELGKTQTATMSSMKQLFEVSGNYPMLRARMKDFLSKPCIPHIGLFTRDLTMLSEQNSTKVIDHKKYINFGKSQTLAKTIGDLKMYQNNINKYKLSQLYPMPLLKYVESQLEEKKKLDAELYKMSKKIEPTKAKK